MLIIVEPLVIGARSWGFIMSHSKVFRQLAKLREAAGAMPSHTVKGLRCFYMSGPRPISCVLGHVTGLLLCFCIKLCLPSNFIFKLACIVPCFQLADMSIIVELGDFNEGSFQRYSYCPQKKYKPTEEAVWCIRNSHGIVRYNECLEDSKIPIIFHKKGF